MKRFISFLAITVMLLSYAIHSFGISNRPGFRDGDMSAYVSYTDTLYATRSYIGSSTVIQDSIYAENADIDTVGTSYIRALSSTGLKVFEDSNVGIYVEDGGDVSISNNSVIPDPTFLLHLQTSTGPDGIGFYISDSDVGDEPGIYLYHSDGTTGTPAATTDGMELGGYVFGGYNGSAWARSASMRGYATELWDGSGYGTDLKFYTTPNNSTTNTLRMTIEQDGDVALSGSTPIGNSITIGDYTSQMDVIVTRQYIPTGTDSSLTITINAGQPEINWFASDGDTYKQTINTSDQEVHTGAAGGYVYGVEDTEDAIFLLMGDATTTEPIIRMYNSAGNDGTEDYWDLQPNGTDYYLGATSDEDVFVFTNDGSLLARKQFTVGDDALSLSGKITYIASDNDQGAVEINTSDQLVSGGFAGGYLYGVSDTEDAIFVLMGDATDADPVIRMENSADNDGTEEYWELQPNGVDYYLGATSDADVFVFTNDGSLLARKQLTIGDDALNLSGKTTYIASDNDQGTVEINTSDQLVSQGFSGGYLYGTDDTEDAIYILYGDATTTEPIIYMYNSAGNDGTEEYWTLQPDGTNYHLGPASDADEHIWSYDGNYTASAHVYAKGSLYGDDAVLGYDGTSATLTTNDTNEDLTIDPNGTGDTLIDGDVGIGPSTPISNSITLGDYTDQVDLIITREGIPAATDSSLKITIASGQPEVIWNASDGDTWKLTTNTSDQAVFNGATGGYAFDDDIFLPDGGVIGYSGSEGRLSFDYVNGAQDTISALGANLLVNTGMIIQHDGTMPAWDHSPTGGAFEGKVEMDGQLHLDNVVYFYSEAVHMNNQPINVGSSSETKIEWDTAETNNALKIGLGHTTSRNIIITGQNHINDDTGTANSDHPTIWMADSTGANLWGYYSNHLDHAMFVGGAGYVFDDSLYAQTVTLVTDLDVTEGGSGVSSLTDHGVLLGSGEADFSVTAVGATGELLTGNTGADPTWSSSPSIGGTLYVDDIHTTGYVQVGEHLTVADSIIVGGRVSFPGGTNDYAMKVGSLGTSTIGIDMSQSGLSGASDYPYYFDANNYWQAGGSLKAGTFYAGAADYFTTSGLISGRVTTISNEYLVLDAHGYGSLMHGVTSTSPSLTGNKTKVGNITDAASRAGEPDLYKASHGLSAAAGDLLHVTDSSTAADEDFYMIVKVTTDSILVTPTLAGTESDVDFAVYQDVIGMFATDGTNGQRMMNYSHQDKPLQIGGVEYQATDGALGSEDVLFGGKVEFDGNSRFDAYASFFNAMFLSDDKAFAIGGSSAASFMWDTNAANDDLFTLKFIESDGTDIPILVVSDASWAPNGDSKFDDITEPSIGFVDDDADSYWYMGFTADDSPGITTDGDVFTFTSSVATDINLYATEVHTTGSVTSGTTVNAASTMQTGTNTGTSGQLTFIASDNDQYAIGITTSDQMTVTGASGGINLGTADTDDMILTLYGDSGTADSKIIMENSDGNDTTENSWAIQPNGTDFYLGPVSDEDEYVFSHDGNFTASGNVAGTTYGSDSSISDAELLTIDDGAVTQIVVGGGAESAFVWGTDIPTAVTIGTAYVYRVGGTDVADADVVTTLTLETILGTPEITSGDLKLGESDVTDGIFILMGDATDADPIIRTENSANNDGTEEYWEQQPNGTQYFLGPTSDPDEYIFNNARGIANSYVVTIDDAGAAENDYTKLTTVGLVGRDYSEVVDDIGSSIDEVGTVATGTWEADVIDHERGGLEADVNAYDGLVKITGGATSAVTITAAGEALLDDAAAANQVTTLGFTATVAEVNTLCDGYSWAAPNALGTGTPANGTFALLTGSDVRIPTSRPGSPGEGSVYTAGDTLYVYQGSEWDVYLKDN